MPLSPVFSPVTEILLCGLSNNGRDSAYNIFFYDDDKDKRMKMNDILPLNFLLEKTLIDWKGKLKMCGSTCAGNSISSSQTFICVISY